MFIYDNRTGHDIVVIDYTHGHYLNRLSNEYRLAIDLNTRAELCAAWFSRWQSIPKCVIPSRDLAVRVAQQTGLIGRFGDFEISEALKPKLLNLPERRENVLLIVSSIAAAHMFHRDDVVTPRTVYNCGREAVASMQFYVGNSLTACRLNKVLEKHRV
jgi:hypothetical protein